MCHVATEAANILNQVERHVCLVGPIRIPTAISDYILGELVCVRRYE